MSGNVQEWTEDVTVKEDGGGTFTVEDADQLKLSPLSPEFGDPFNQDRRHTRRAFHATHGKLSHVTQHI